MNTSKEKCLCGAVGDGVGALVVEHRTSETPITENTALARFKNRDPHLSVVYAIEDELPELSSIHQKEPTARKWRLVYRWYPVCRYDNNYDCV